MHDNGKLHNLLNQGNLFNERYRLFVGHEVSCLVSSHHRRR